MYSEEITGEIDIIKKVAANGRTYVGVRVLLDSHESMTNDDDRSAVVFWFPGTLDGFFKAERLFALASAMCKWYDQWITQEQATDGLEAVTTKEG